MPFAFFLHSAGQIEFEFTRFYVRVERDTLVNFTLRLNGGKPVERHNFSALALYVRNFLYAVYFSRGKFYKRQKGSGARV